MSPSLPGLESKRASLSLAAWAGAGQGGPGLFGKEVEATQTSAEAICRAEGLLGTRCRQVFPPWQS